MENTQLTPLSKKDEDKIYGANRKTEIGKCFVCYEGSRQHFYRQHENHVLYIMIADDGELANTIHVGFMNKKSRKNYPEIEPKEFEANLMKVKQILNI